MLARARVEENLPTFIDELTLARAKRGDLAAFGVVVARTVPAVHGFLCRMLLETGQLADVTELVHETFLTVHRGLPSYTLRTESDLSSAVLMIATRVALARCGAQRSGRPRSPSGALLATIDGRLRAALLLRHFYCLDDAQIGSAIGTGSKPVDGHLDRARSQMQGVSDVRAWLRGAALPYSSAGLADAVMETVAAGHHIRREGVARSSRFQQVIIASLVGLVLVLGVALGTADSELSITVAPAEARALPAPVVAPAREPVAAKSPARIEETTAPSFAPARRAASPKRRPPIDLVANARQAALAGDYGRRSRLCRAALEKRPDDVHARSICLVSACARNRASEARTHFRRLPASRRSQARQQCLTHGVELGPDIADLITKATRSALRNDYRETLRHCGRALSLDSKQHRARVLCAIAACSLGQEASAQRHLARLPADQRRQSRQVCASKRAR
ncbi:MAG: hypothetical protein KJO07_16690 [Deltaproteobacteria bacterium]|nr:hypothetical protein [Deltaproteobacteria bacterium]